MAKAVIGVRISHEDVERLDALAAAQAQRATETTHRVVEPSRSATALGLILQGLVALDATATKAVDRTVPSSLQD